MKHPDCKQPPPNLPLHPQGEGRIFYAEYSNAH
jgi:hypothetical protein